MDEIIEITPASLPYDLDEKIFVNCDEHGIPIGQPYSYNDYLKFIESISGVNEEFLGEEKD